MRTPTSEVSFGVGGLPPAKNEAKSMLAAGHLYSDRVLALLRAARETVGPTPQPVFPSARLGLDSSSLRPPTRPRRRATLAASRTVLEAKTRRGGLDHLADLAHVALYANDRQIQEVGYRHERAEEARYAVRNWVLE